MQENSAGSSWGVTGRQSSCSPADRRAIALLALESRVIQVRRGLAYRAVGVVTRAAALRVRSTATASAIATTVIVASNP